MKTTPLGAFPGYQPCDKLDPQWIDAYTEIRLDPENPTGIILDTSWGEVKLDLASIVKNGETITHLDLAPEDEPTVLRYKNEAGDYECITGDELSRIISLQLLKDVDQTTAPTDGIVYQYDENSGLFVPFNLKAFVTATNHTLNQLSASITNLQNQITNLQSQITAITNIIPFWDDDKTTKVARGQINIISDPTNTNNKTYGLFTHDKGTDQYADEYFA